MREIAKIRSEKIELKAYLFTVSLECKDIPFFTLAIEIDALLTLLVQHLNQFSLTTIFSSGFVLDTSKTRIRPKPITAEKGSAARGINGFYFKHRFANILWSIGLIGEDTIKNGLSAGVS
jgi:hypothetical protein